jgi:hypothetical protein
MATEILVNDGGAPARILPYTAGSTVSAGRLVTIASDGQIDHAAASGTKVLGVTLTAAESGNVANVISGHGVQLNVFASASAAMLIGDELVARVSDGCLVEKTDGTHQGQVLAIALEAKDAAATGLTKVQMI